MKELWKDIKNYEGRYQISNKGRVKSLQRISESNTHTRTVPERILKPIQTSSGLRINLVKENIQTGVFLANLVMLYFGDKSSGYVTFKDRNYQNCSIENLQWTKLRKTPIDIKLQEIIPVQDKYKKHKTVKTPSDDILQILNKLKSNCNIEQRAKINAALSMYNYMQNKDLTKLLKEIL